MAHAHAQCTDLQPTSLTRAAAAHRREARLRDRLGHETTDLAQIAREAIGDHMLQKMRVSEFLAALPQIGVRQARVVMTELGLAPTRELGRLTDCQRAALMSVLQSTAAPPIAV